ncbi:MAG: hypothetical protein OIF40_06555 [Mangrovicoccus sp.]|nr:hypothetical protein [Mangrovicoccus sp.]
MIRRLLPPALALAALAAAYWGYSEITQLRGTIFWEFRYLVLGLGCFALLSVLETVLSRLLPPKEHDH